MTNFIQPQTAQEQEALTRALIETDNHYIKGRDTPAPYIAPPPTPEQVAPQPFPHRKVAIAAGYVAGTAVVVTGVVAVCKAVVTGIAAFAAANAATIGGVAVAGFVVALVVSGLGKSEQGVNVSTTQGNKEEGQQTIININVAAGGGRVEVNK